MQRIVRDNRETAHACGKLSLLHATENAASTAVQNVERILRRMSKTDSVVTVVYVPHGSQTSSRSCRKLFWKDRCWQIVLSHDVTTRDDVLRACPQAISYNAAKCLGRTDTVGARMPNTLWFWMIKSCSNVVWSGFGMVFHNQTGRPFQIWPNNSHLEFPCTDFLYSLSRKFRLNKRWLSEKFGTTRGFPQWFWLVPSRLFPGFSRATGPEKSNLVPVPPIREWHSSLILSRLKRTWGNADLWFYSQLCFTNSQQSSKNIFTAYHRQIN